jgi:hypothetical protein
MSCHCANCGLPIVSTGNPLAILAAKTVAKKLAKKLAKDGIKQADHYAQDLVNKAQKKAKQEAPHLIDQGAGSAKKMIKDARKQAMNALNRI